MSKTTSTIKETFLKNVESHLINCREAVNMLGEIVDVTLYTKLFINGLIGTTEEIEKVTFWENNQNPEAMSFSASAYGYEARTLFMKHADNPTETFDCFYALFENANLDEDDWQEFNSYYHIL